MSGFRLKDTAFLMLSIISVLIVLAAPCRADFYVSPEGNDNSPGTIDNPFRPIESARDTVRTLNDHMTENITVYLRGGTHELDSTLVLTEEDSGTNGFYVIYKGFQDEEAIISGGERIYRWRINDTQKNIWEARVENTAHLNLFLEDMDTRQLYVNGVRAVRARTESTLDSVTRTDRGFLIEDAFPFPLTSLTDAEVVQNFCWKNFRCGIEDVSGSELMINDSCNSSIAWDQERFKKKKKNTEYWIENSYELLDSPGEWYHDYNAAKVLYIPRGGEDIYSSTVIVPLLERLVYGEESLSHIKFEGLTFSYATWNEPSQGAGFRAAQADYYGEAGNVRTILANVEFEAVKDIIFEDNIFTHLGGTALAFEQGSDRISVRGNLFKDISATAVRVGGNSRCLSEADSCVTEGNVVENNMITDSANEYFNSVGIMLGYARDSSLSHNTIHDLPYSGIHNGWGWGTQDPTYSGNNLIQNNHIYDNMQVLHDGGGIYTLSAQPGSIISGNVITGHQAKEPADTTGGAMYLDKASRYIEIHDNVLIGNVIRNLIVKGGDHNIHDNYWEDRGTFIIQDGREVVDIRFTDNEDCVTDTCGPILVENNNNITSISQAPSSITDSAGINGGFSLSESVKVVGHEEPPITSLNGDFDGDGEEDTLWIYQKSLNWFVESSIRGENELWFTMTFGIAYGTLPADMDGDGKDDVVLGVNTSDGWKWQYVKSTGSSFSAYRNVLLGQEIVSDACVRDYDEDGSDEIIITDSVNICLSWNQQEEIMDSVPCEASCQLHRADIDPPFGKITMNELLAFIELWYQDSVQYSMKEAIDAINLWRSG